MSQRTSEQPLKVVDANDDPGRRAPDYVEQVRRAAGRLAMRPVRPGDVPTSLLAVEDAADIDVDVPTRASRPGVRVVKVVMKRLVGWQLRYLGGQLGVLGEAVVRLGHALADRSEMLEEQTAQIHRDVAALDARLARLEEKAPVGEG